MGNLRVWKVGSYAAEFKAHGATVWEDLKANPGTTLGAIATRLNLSTAIIKRILLALDTQGGLYRGHDTTGNEYVWRIGDFADIAVSNFQAARDWLEIHDGALASQMAAELGLHEAVALRLAYLLDREGSAKVTPE